MGSTGVLWRFIVSAADLARSRVADYGLGSVEWGIEIGYINRGRRGMDYSSGSSDEDLDGEDWCVVCKGDNKIDRTPSLESDLCGHK